LLKIVVRIRARSFEVDFNVKRESPSQTYKLERDRFNLKRSRSKETASRVRLAFASSCPDPSPFRDLVGNLILRPTKPMGRMPRRTLADQPFTPYKYYIETEFNQQRQGHGHFGYRAILFLPQIKRMNRTG
jgi:hypothetical protein